MTDEGECSGGCNDSDTTSSLLPELQTGLGEGKALYHKKEYDAAIHTIEEVLGSSANKRLLSEVCRYFGCDWDLNISIVPSMEWRFSLFVSRALSLLPSAYEIQLVFHIKCE